MGQQQELTRRDEGAAGLVKKAQDWVEKTAHVLEDYLPPRVNERRWLAGAALAIADDDYLLAALKKEEGRRTMVSALCRAAQIGLSLNPEDKFAHLEARGGRIAYSLDAPGMIELGTRHGIKEVRTRTIYDGDELAIKETARGDDYELTPAIDDRGDIRGFLAVAILPNDTVRVHYQTRQQVEAWRDKYGTKKKGGGFIPLWTKSFEGAGQKTVVKQLLSKLKIATPDDDVIEIDAGPAERGTSPAELEAELTREDDEEDSDEGGFEPPM